MAKLNAYSIYDSKAEAFLKPIYTSNDQLAIRSFVAAVAADGHDFNTYAEDYSLHHTGYWTEETSEHENIINRQILTGQEAKSIIRAKQEQAELNEAYDRQLGKQEFLKRATRLNTSIVPNDQENK